jgi:hypothetical protein
MAEVVMIQKDFLDNLRNTLRNIERQHKDLLMTSDLINESDAAHLLDIEKETLQKNVSTGKIPANYYTTGLHGKRFYFKSKLLGL